MRYVTARITDQKDMVWHDAIEVLPEPEGADESVSIVLMLDKSNSMWGGALGWYMHDFSKWVNCDGDCGWCPNVTHWMPLIHPDDGPKIEV